MNTPARAPTPSLSERLGIDWLSKLRHLLQVLAFCLAIATLQVAFAPERPYTSTLVYSLLIGFFIWAFIDLGRHLPPSSAETGWPTGMTGVLLVAIGIAAGYLLGTALADLGCRYFNWYEGAPPRNNAADLRQSVLITVMASVVGSFYFYATGRSEHLERKVAETRRHADEARLRLLESQLEPHMLFNTLANLRALISTDPPRATAMLDRIITYLRATLAASRTPHHALQAEFDRLQDYLELMTVRMGPRLRYTLELPVELASHPVPALLLQPLVENSIRHGLEPKTEGGHIRIQAQRNDHHIVLQVEDDGQGLHAPSESTGTRFGLVQVRERLAAEYGPSASLTLQSAEGGGTRVTLSFPDPS
jgi:signal transduction histidine kinase